MSEVRYSVNGKYFKDFGTYISSSEGLFDALKRKPVNTYDWAEYHGSSPDLSNPKFEQREITLKGFVTGSNWETMKSNFDAIVSEFQKAGTQRLLIEPFGLKPLPYEVCMIDEVRMQKDFTNGRMVGIFTLKLIEPNPIKKVLYFTGNTLNLSYNSPNETEIFYGNGLKETAKGNVSLSNKTLANRVVSGYDFQGRNLLLNSTKYNYSEWATFNGGVAIPQGDLGISLSKNMHINHGQTFVVGQEYTFSFDYVGTTPFEVSVGAKVVKIETPKESGKGKFFITYTYAENFNTYIYISNNIVGTSVTVKGLKLSKGNLISDWTPAPEDEKHIIIAGNVEEITNLTTNAKILWEKL